MCLTREFTVCFLRDKLKIFFFSIIIEQNQCCGVEWCLLYRRVFCPRLMIHWLWLIFSLSSPSVDLTHVIVLFYTFLLFLFFLSLFIFDKLCIYCLLILDLYEKKWLYYIYCISIHTEILRYCFCKSVSNSYTWPRSPGVFPVFSRCPWRHRLRNLVTLMCVK